MTPPRTGPQGMTMDDLRRVTGRTTTSPRPSVPRLSTQELVSSIIGGPINTADKKYAGFGTLEQLKTAVLGGLEPFMAARDLAAAQAAQKRADIYAASVFQPRTPADYERVAAEEQRISRALATPVDPGLSARVGLAREVENRQRALADTEARLAELNMQPDYQAVRRGRMDAMEAIKQLRANQAATPTSALAQRLAGAQTPEQARQEAYGRSMARLNEIALAPVTSYQYTAERGPEVGATRDVREITMRNAALANLGTPVSGEVLRREVYPLAEVAQQLGAGPIQGIRTQAADIQGITASELARQIATQNYAVDPALAAGMFGPEFEREVGLRQLGEAGVFPDQSIEEYIGLNQGPEALATFQQNQLQAALDKQNEGFRTADEEAFDLQLEQNTGLNVDAVAGDYSRAVARGYLENPDFVQRVNAEVGNLVANPALNMEQQKNQARIAAQQYLTDTGDPVGAQILLNALLSFDFTLAFSAG